VNWLIPINAPQIGKEEIDAVVKVLKTGILTHGLGAGPNVAEFERLFAQYMCAKHAIAMNTGTACLHSSLAAIEIKRGNEIILPSFTFVATAEAILMAGGKPVFVDIDPKTYNIDPQKIEKAVTKKTKAIMPVDLYGLPAHMEPIGEIAHKHSLKIVEDAAQAHGATYKGKPPGAYADAACWSFYGSKNMTTGEGGMITTNDDELARTVRFMRSHGEKEKYMSTMLGHNYHMPEMEATIGRVQLGKLPTFLQKRRKNAEMLTDRLKRAKNLQLPAEPKGFKHSWYLYTVRMKNATKNKRDKVVQGLSAKGIGSVVCYMNPIHLMPFYSKLGKWRLPETEKASKQVFSLPVHPGVTSDQIDFIAETVLHLLR